MQQAVHRQDVEDGGSGSVVREEKGLVERQGEGL